MKDFNEYNSKVKYPRQATFTTIYGYTQGKLVFEYNANDWAALTIKPESNIIERYVDKTAYKEAKKHYSTDQNRLYNQFKTDLFEDFDVQDNPRKDKVFSLAWEQGHSSGYSDVYNVFCDLVDLITD